jgi:hypothetical protein
MGMTDYILAVAIVLLVAAGPVFLAYEMWRSAR